MNEKLKEMAQRIVFLREICSYSTEEMAEATGMTAAEYEAYERGEEDFSFTFLYNVARKLGVDMTELFTGEAPHLSTYTVTRNGEGLPMKRYEGYEYNHLAYLVKNRIGDPFLVRAKYKPENDVGPLHLNQHKGQEFDFILDGQLRVQILDNEYVLNAGDSIYYDSSHGHGMEATGGKDCLFLAVVMKDEETDHVKED